MDKSTIAIASLAICFFILKVDSILPGQEQPKSMTKLVVRLESPDVQEGSFQTKPKTIYRSGTRYCRIEETPDDKHGIYGLVVINEPDIWLVNLFRMDAQHHVDSGPTFNCRLPMFIFGQDVKSDADVKNSLFELEFGHELAYFKERGATSKQGPVLQGKSTNAYSVLISDSQLFLFMTADLKSAPETPERPLLVVRQHGPTREAYWYSSYENLPFDSNLFAKPTNVRIEEVSP
jgi:hypothetical protein